MRVSIITTCAALVVAMAPAALRGQGPVREGLRRTGEAAVQGTRGVVQGAGQIVQGAGQAVGQGVRAGAEVTGDVLRGTAQGIGAGVRAVTPAIPWQAGQGAAVADRGRDARWRMQRHHGEWWFYTPENTWMYHRDGNWNQFAEDSYQAPQSYSTGYRGVGQDAAQYGAEQAAAHEGQPGAAHKLYTDSQGREYICEHGQRVYLDQPGQASGEGQPTPAQSQDPADQAAPDQSSVQPQDQQPPATAPQQGEPADQPQATEQPAQAPAATSEQAPGSSAQNEPASAQQGGKAAGDAGTLSR